MQIKVVRFPQHRERHPDRPVTLYVLPDDRILVVEKHTGQICARNLEEGETYEVVREVNVDPRIVSVAKILVIATGQVKDLLKEGTTS